MPEDYLELKQEVEINRANLKRVFTPEFIPYYKGVVDGFRLTPFQGLVYGFIRFYMTRAGVGEKFYFTNKQLAEIVGCSEVSISEKIIPVLKKKGLISVKYEIKAGGGKIRFVTKVYTGLGIQKRKEVENIKSDPYKSMDSDPYKSMDSDPHKSMDSDPHKSMDKRKNKIKENKINNIISKDIGAKAPITHKGKNKTSSTVVQLQEVIDYFNKVVDSNHKALPRLGAVLKSRVKEGFSKEDIFKAIDNAKDNAFLMGDNPNGKRYLTPEYILRPDKLDEWVNTKKPKRKFYT